jgi:hypothetical protein
MSDEEKALSPVAKIASLEEQIEALLERLSTEQLELLQTMIEERLAKCQANNKPE